MRRYLIVNYPMTSQQTIDAATSGVTAPRVCVDGSGKAFIAFDNGVPASFEGIITYTYDEATAIALSTIWHIPGFGGR